MGWFKNVVGGSAGVVVVVAGLGTAGYYGLKYGFNELADRDGDGNPTTSELMQRGGDAVIWAGDKALEAGRAVQDDAPRVFAELEKSYKKHWGDSKSTSTTSSNGEIDYAALGCDVDKKTGLPKDLDCVLEPTQ